MARSGFVYILASKPQGTLYVGVTSNLVGRIWQHREDVVDGFTNRNNIKKLVWYESFDDIAEAIAFEKKIKKMAARMEASPDRKE